MKRAEIHAGDVLYCDPSRDWADPRWMAEPSNPVTVKEVPTSGTRVLVTGAFNGAHWTPSASLRGPYDECRAVVAAAIAKRDAARKAADDEKVAAKARFASLHARAIRLGCSFTNAGTPGYALVSHDVLDVLLAAAEATP